MSSPILWNETKNLSHFTKWVHLSFETEQKISATLQAHSHLISDTEAAYWS